MELFYATGIRIQELSGINLESIQGDDVILVRGKGKKERQVVFGEPAQDALRMYFAARKGHWARSTAPATLFLWTNRRWGSNRTSDGTANQPHHEAGRKICWSAGAESP